MRHLFAYFRGVCSGAFLEGPQVVYLATGKPKHVILARRFKVINGAPSCPINCHHVQRTQRIHQRGGTAGKESLRATLSPLS